MIEFTIPIIPKAQMRIRSASIAGHAVSYKAKEQRWNENNMMALIYQYKPAEPIQSPILLTIEAYLPIPKSKSKKWRELAVEGKIKPITKPDLDNLIKNILDCMTQLSFWRDDSQIAQIQAGKYYSIKPRWVIQIYELENI